MSPKERPVLPTQGFYKALNKHHTRKPGPIIWKSRFHHPLQDLRSAALGSQACVEIIGLSWDSATHTRNTSTYQFLPGLSELQPGISMNAAWHKTVSLLKTRWDYGGGGWSGGEVNQSYCSPVWLQCHITMSTGWTYLGPSPLLFWY